MWPRFPGVSPAFITWSVCSMRNRANWEVTSVENFRNVLGLITAFALERRDVATIDPDGSKYVFEGCMGLSGIVITDPFMEIERDPRDFNCEY